MPKSRAAVFIAGCILLLIQGAAALPSSPLAYRTFINGSALWLVDPSGIRLFRSDNRSVSTIRLSDTAASDSILDVAENSQLLWVLARSGVYDIDLTTMTVERLPGNKIPYGGGRLTVDDDYLWVGFGDTLWRFDKLGREWFPYKINSAGNDLRGIYSNGTNVFCVQSASVRIFSAKDEKWLEFPYQKGMVISSAAQYWIDKATMVFVDGRNIYRYLSATQTWDILKASSPVVDMVSQDTALFYQTSAGIFKYSTSTSVTMPFEIPHPAEVRCFVPYSSDTVLCPTDNNILKYALSSKTTDFILAPQGLAEYHPLKAIMIGGTFTLITPTAISIYTAASQSWENTLLATGGGSRQTAAWDDNGARVNYGGGCSSQLKGSIQKEYYIDSLTVRKDTTFLSYDNKVPVAGLTLHNTFAKGRYFDAFFDNTNISQLPSKGLFYRGADSDVVEEARLGTTAFANTNTLSQTLPTMQFEGGSAVLQSAAGLATRDRKFVKVQAGLGNQTTQSVSAVLSYTEGGLYTIPLPNDTPKTIVVPGSMQITIDGVAVDSANFTLVAQTGSLTFNQSVPIDPSSVIRVTYQIQAVPNVPTQELYQQVQGVPKNSFENVGYASATVSPADWISPQVGVYALNGDSSRTTLINAAVPLEIRTASQSLYLRLNPEMSVDAATSKKAEGVALQSRFGPQLSLLANALVQDSGFKTTNNTSRGYGDLLHNYNMTATYDITKEMPVSYIGQDIASTHGLEQLNEVTASAHFLGLPFCDVTLANSAVNAQIQHSRPQIDSTSLFDTNRTTGVIDTTHKLDTIPADTLSLKRTKDKVTINLYETSSPFMESLLHINRLTYNLSWTGFASQNHDTAGRGGFFYGTATVCPTKRVSISGNGTFLNNPIGSQFSRDYSPTLILQTIDAPPGIDLSASNYNHYQSLMDSNTSTSQIIRSASMTIKPGSWVSMMSWISPIVGLSQTLNCSYDQATPGTLDLLYGGNVVHNSITKDVGANVYPTNNITWRNDNQFSAADSSTTYYSFNDLKWWFTSKQLWQTRWEYTHTVPRYGGGDTSSKTLDYQHGFTKYTNNWNSWLQTMTGIDAMYMAHDTGSSLQAGPDISVNITKQKALCFKSILVDQTVTVYAVKNDYAWAQGPAISYQLYFKAVILPNISLTGTNSFSFTGGAFRKYSGDIIAALIF